MHVAGSHTQRPLWHFVPAVHAAAEPHMHTPLVQESATVVLHVVQAFPPVPQVATEFDSHVVPAQHPVAHDVASQVHRPSTQRCPGAQGAPVPHAQ